MQKGGEPATQAQIIEVIAASAAAAAFAKDLGFDGVETTVLMAACSTSSYGRQRTFETTLTCAVCETHAPDG
jgi:hypothetical protein